MLTRTQTLLAKSNLYSGIDYNSLIDIIHIDSNLYVVNHTNAVYGSWTGNPTITITETFDDYYKALDYYDDLVNKFKRYDDENNN